MAARPPAGPDPLVLGGRPSSRFARVVAAVETEIGRKLTWWGTDGEAPILVPGELEARSGAWGEGRVVLWIEPCTRKGAIGGVVRRWSVGTGSVVDLPFEAILPARPWQGAEAFASTAARMVLQVARRSVLAPWPLLEAPVDGATTAWWKRLVESRSWTLAGLDSQGRVRWREARDGFTLADPFPIVRRDHQWLFFEEQRRGRYGVLSAGVLDGGRLTEIVHDILPASTHRSWPNVFEHAGETWMVPESGEDREVALWRCERFPDRWEKVRVLLSGDSWTDPVLFPHEGTWWLFVSGSGPSPLAHSDSLHLFHSPDPWRKPFAAHPWNPVSVGVAGSRPAGRIFFEAGRMIRPAQDGSSHYGRALLFREILELNPQAYRESTLRRFAAPAGACGIHTWNRTEAGLVVDLLVPGSRLGLARRGSESR